MSRLKVSCLSSERWKWHAVTSIDVKLQDLHDQEKKGHLPLFTKKPFDMSERHNLSLQELLRFSYWWRTWQSFLLKGWNCFIFSCCSEVCQCILHRALFVYRYKKEFNCYHLICIFNICSSSSRKKIELKQILKRDQKNNRHYIAKTVDFQFRMYIFWLQLTKHWLFWNDTHCLQLQSGSVWSRMVLIWTTLCYSRSCPAWWSLFCHLG